MFLFHCNHLASPKTNFHLQGSKYAATQAGAHCFCGDDYDRYGPSNGCKSKCPGNQAETCGGGWANEVFQVGE